MACLHLLAEIKRKSLELFLIDKDKGGSKVVNKQSIECQGLTKEQLKAHIGQFVAAQKDQKRIERKLVVGCFFFDDALMAAMQLKLNRAKFNGPIPDLSSDLTFIDKHELVCLNDYTQPSSFFEFNKKEIQPGHKGLIVSIGNHLQVFEEHVKGVNGRKEVIRIDLGALSFSPHTEFEHDFSLFIRKGTKRTVKYKEFINKAGFKLVYLFHMQVQHGEVPKEPSFRELLALIQQKNPVALKSVEFFFYLLAHFLYSGLILLMLNKELIMTGDFLRKVITAFNDDDRVRAVFFDNLVLAHHVKQTFDHLRISLQTQINELVIKSAVENF